MFFLKTKKFKPFAVLSAIGLLGFLEELSFGERLFNLSMPRIGPAKIDSLHDFFYVGHKGIIKLMNDSAAAASLFFASMCLFLLALGLRYRARLLRATFTVRKHPPYLLAIFFIVLAFTALVIDLHIFCYDFLFMIEEMFELNAALALIFCCFSIYNLQSGKNAK